MELFWPAALGDDAFAPEEDPFPFVELLLPAALGAARVGDAVEVVFDGDGAVREVRGGEDDRPRS